MNKPAALPIPVKTDSRIWISLSTIFFLIIFTQLPFIIFNKILDTGYHLANQELANHLGLQYINTMPFWWLSDIVGGWWLSITSSFGMWGARFGGLFALALTGAFSANTLFQIEKPTLSILLTMVFVALCLPNDTINYVSFPTLLFSIFALFFVKMHKEPRQINYPIFAALSFVLLVLARMPLIVLSLFFFFSFFLCIRYKKEQRRLYGKAYSRLLICILAFFISYALLLHFNNLFQGYFFYKAPTESHTSSTLLSLLLLQLKAKLSVIFSSALFGLVLFILIRKKKLSSRLALSFLVINFAVAALYVKFPSIKSALFLIWPDAFDVYPILIAINICCISLLKKGLKVEEMILFSLGIAWPMLLTIGSAAGILIWFMIGFLLCGQTVLLLTRVAHAYDCKIPLFCLGAVLFLIIGGKGFKELSYPYYHSQFKMSASHKTENLRGIYSTKERVATLDPLIAEIKKHTKKGDRILAEPFFSLIYYASDTLPFDNHPCLLYLPSGQYIQRLKKFATLPPPKLIVKPKIAGQPQDLWTKFLWPYDSSYTFTNNLKEKYQILEQSLQTTWKLKRIWSNDAYELFAVEPL